MNIRKPMISVLAAGAGVVLVLAPLSAQAQTDPPESGNCKVQISGFGSSTMSAQAGQCHLEAGDPGPLTMGVSYRFYSSDGQKYTYEKNCTKGTNTLADCYKKISHTFKDPAGKQQFSLEAEVSYYFYNGLGRNDSRKIVLTH